MSQLVSLYANNTNGASTGEFNNYFDNTFQIPPNSEVAFIKCNAINTQYYDYRFLTVPQITTLARTINILEVTVDGVTVLLSWLNLYNALVRSYQLEYEGDIPVAEGDFFNGTFKWSLNPSEPGNCIQSICFAIDERLEFYRIEPHCQYNVQGLADASLFPSRFGITSIYTTNKRLNPKIIARDLENIDNLSVYSGSADLEAGKITTTSANTTVFSRTNIAINGGMVAWEIDTDKECKIGVSFDVADFGGQTGSNSTVDLDFGIHYKVNGTGTYYIIRNGETTQGVLQADLTNNDQKRFSIVFSRTSLPEAERTTSYTAYLLQGYEWFNTTPNFVGKGDYENHIVARQEMVGGFMPTFIAELIDDATVINNIYAIDATDQDRESRNFLDSVETEELPDETKAFAVGSGTIYRNAHAFSFRGDLDNADKKLEANFTREFFVKLGFVNFSISTQTTTEDYKCVEVLGNNLSTSLVISSECEADIQDVVVYSTTPLLTLTPSFTNVITPYDYLQLHMDDLSIITYEGNEPNGRQQNTASKVLQNLPINPDKKTILNRSIVGDYQSLFTSYDYEAYNPIYVSLHNTEPIMINQIKCRLATPDNQGVSLESNKLANIMLHFRKEQK